MKTPLAARIETYLNCDREQRITQKELAVSLHNRCGRVKLTTIEEKLSKLMNGRVDGERFFSTPEQLMALADQLSEASERLEHLLQIPTLVLHPGLPEPARVYLRERAKECYGTAEWIVEPAVSQAGVGHHPEPVETVRALQQATSELDRPILVIVTAEIFSRETDRSLYGLARLPVAVLARKPRGYEIVEHAGILPLPDAAPPKRVDDDGQPLYPVAAMAAWADKAWRLLPQQENRSSQTEWRHFEGVLMREEPDADSRRVAYQEFHSRSGSALFQRLHPILEDEGVPSFRALEVLRWLCSPSGERCPAFIASKPPSFVRLLAPEVAQRWNITPKPRPSMWHGTTEGPLIIVQSPNDGEQEETAIVEAVPDALAADIADERFGKTTIWEHAGRWFIVGDAVSELQQSLLKHCPDLALHRPELPARLAQLLREDHNPWMEDPKWLVELRQSTLRECGVDMKEAFALWRNEEVLRHAERHCYYEFEGTVEPQTQQIRERLGSILSRKFELAETQAWAVFVLRQALNAELLFADADSDCANWDAVANLGAGHLIRIRVTHYPREAEESIRLLTDDDFEKLGFGKNSFETHLDGGNLHLQIATLPVVYILEGNVALASRRARGEGAAKHEAAAEAERQQRAYDDDDE